MARPAPHATSRLAARAARSRWRVWKRSTSTGLDPDPNYHDLVCCIGEGGCVHPHIDSASDKRGHVRLNLLVAKPESGCTPLLDGVPIDIGLGDAWLCFASRCEHATTPVVGRKSRIILSYGLQVQQVSIFGLLAQYFSWKQAAAAPA